MINFFLAGGWLMYPLLGCSIVMLAIIVERAWVLRPRKIIPPDLVNRILNQLANKSEPTLKLSEIASQSPLGLILSRGLQHTEQGTTLMRARMEDQGRQVLIDLEMYLSTLGTIASAAPLLGLLGTVLGMIQIFSVMGGTPHAEALAGGIAQALLTTAFGLFVAIPSLMFHRFFRRRIDELSVELERESQRMIDGLKAMAPALAMRRVDFTE